MGNIGKICPQCKTNTIKSFDAEVCWDCHIKNKKSNAKYHIGHKRLKVPCERCNGKNLRNSESPMCRPCSDEERGRIWESLQIGIIPKGIYCKVCGAELSADNWPEYLRKYNRKVNHKCWTCYRKQANKILKKHYPKTAEKQRNLRKEVIKHYGGKCVCCGEKEIAFLSIDHIHNDGNHRRKRDPREYNIYRFAKMNDYPTDLQILCHNCNWAKAKNPGGCPHQLKKRTAKAIK